jgi:SSS family solute:Na+ symporter
VLTQGLSASWYVIAAGIGFVLVSFIAPYFRRSSASTVPEIISKRYGKPAHIFTAFTSIAALFMATGAQIIATASIINVVTGLSFQTAAIVCTLVVIAYTMVGGFTSVTAANMMHVSFITVGMTIAMFIMLGNPHVGGMSALFAKARELTNASGANIDVLSMTKVGFPTIIG